MSFLSGIGKWFAKVFKSVEQDFDKVAISITEEIKAGLDSGILAVIANALDALTGHVSTEVLALLKIGIPKALAIELAIQGIPVNPTAADIQTFETSVLTAIGGATLVQKSKLWTTLAAQIYTMIQEALKVDNGSLTFAEIVELIEDAYQQYLADQQDQTNDPNA